MFRDNEAKVHELNYLFWECTARCNLHCRHCGSDCLAASADADMPLEDFLAAFDTIPKKKMPDRFTVVLTGGEPLLRGDICAAIRAISARGAAVGMVSNGYFYDESMHADLMASGLRALTISLDGLGEDHDWMRGREGSFERAAKAIAIAAREPRLNFDVVTCVTKRNLPHLEEIRHSLISLGVRKWRIFTIIPIGRATDDPELHLSDSEFVSLMEYIKEKRGNPDSPLRLAFGCEGYLGPYEGEVRNHPYICRAGLTIASVLIDGRISGCPNIDRDAFSQGNIYKDSFYEVWNNRFGPYRDRTWTRTGRCRDCPAFRDCLGNGMHNWHGDCREVINCHFHKIVK
ncbi:MAG: TIGR04133 family radical SAM/SPASM protein [Bacteroidales bacterium]|nr:TIGR04133 family radical SAM/SPASM protein [Bacteroidales bacterium]